MIDSSSSRRQLPTQRSATPFCQGAWMPVRVGSRPVAFMNPVTWPSNVESWSNSMKRCGPSPGNTSRSCCTTHAGDGSRVAVIGEEGRPAGGGIAAAWHATQIPGDAAFGDGEAELQEFPMEPGRPPVRILRRQATDEGPNLLADSRPAPAVSGSPAPVEAKAGSMPPDDGFRFHDEQHV